MITLRKIPTNIIFCTLTHIDVERNFFRYYFQLSLEWLGKKECTLLHLKSGRTTNSHESYLIKGPLYKPQLSWICNIKIDKWILFDLLKFWGWFVAQFIQSIHNDGIQSIGALEDCRQSSCWKKVYTEKQEQHKITQNLKSVGELIDLWPKQ